jgi:hypothetical protein
MKRLVAFSFLAACASSTTAPQAVQATAAASAPPQATSPSKSPGARVRVPSAVHGDALLDGVPVVSVVDGKVFFGDDTVGDTRETLDAGHPKRVDGLFIAGKDYREKWSAAHAGAPFPGVVLQAFDAHAPILVVKSVFQTIAFAGFPNEQLEVRNPDGTLGRLDVDASIPTSKDGVTVDVDEPVLFVDVTASKLELVLKKGGVVVSVFDVASSADLATRMQETWRAYGEHSDPTDRKLDQAIVVASDDLDYATVVAVVDALKTARRDYVLKGKKERVAAYNVTLRLATPPSAPPVKR